MIRRYVRGMVYWADITITAYCKHLQPKRRPVIIISNDVGNFFSGNVTIIPCTTNVEKNASQPTHFTTELTKGVTTIVLCENIQTVDKSILGDFIGMLDKETMIEISKALGIALGFTDLKLNPKPLASNTKIEDIQEVQEEQKKEEKPIKIPTTTNGVDRSTKTPAYMRKYLKDLEEYGVEFVRVRYKLPSVSAVHQRKLRYKKALDNSK
jgi:mRNA interferase MazF